MKRQKPKKKLDTPGPFNDQLLKRTAQGKSFMAPWLSEPVVLPTNMNLVGITIPYYQVWNGFVTATIWNSDERRLARFVIGRLEKPKKGGALDWDAHVKKLKRLEKKLSGKQI